MRSSHLSPQASSSLQIGSIGHKPRHGHGPVELALEGNRLRNSEHMASSSTRRDQWSKACGSAHCSAEGSSSLAMHACFSCRQDDCISAGFTCLHNRAFKEWYPKRSSAGWLKTPQNGPYLICGGNLSGQHNPLSGQHNPTRVGQ